MERIEVKRHWYWLPWLALSLVFAYGFGSYCNYLLFGNKPEHYEWRDSLLFGLGKESVGAGHALERSCPDMALQANYQTYIKLFGPARSSVVTWYGGSGNKRTLEITVQRNSAVMHERYEFLDGIVVAWKSSPGLHGREGAQTQQ